MSKFTPPDLEAGYRSAEKISQAFDDIAQALDNTLSRDGTTPNQMESALDMNSNRILNLPAPVSGTDPVRLKDIAGITGGGTIGSVLWEDILGVPDTFPPDPHTHPVTDITGLQEAVEDYIGASITAGENVAVTYDDATGKVTISSTAVGGGGGTTINIVDFVAVYGGNGDGTTNNDTAFTNAEASANPFIYLPPGRYYTTIPIANLTKRYWGPGKIWRGGQSGTYPNYGRYSTEVHPVVDPLWAYGVAEDNEFGDPEWRVIAPGMRKGFDRYLQTPGNPNGFPTYFWAPSTPHFLRFQNQGGWSGFSGLTTSDITAGSTTSVDISGGTAGWNVGDTVGFTNTMDGLITETKVLTGVTSTTISWSGTLTNNYPIGSTVTHGYRTMNAAYVTIANATGGGDTYIHTARMTVDYDGLASQTAFQNRATGGLFGGELILTKPGVYGTGWEGIYQDTGADAACIGTVNSYVRTNNTGNFGNMWLHDYAKMDGGGTYFGTYGLKRIDGIYVAALGAHTGLDLTNSTFDVAAVALPIEQKIALDAQIVAPGPSNGNGFVATTDGGMFIRGSATSVAGTKVLELINGSYRIRLQANGGLTTNAGLTVGNNISASGTITGSSLYSTGGRVYLNSSNGTYIDYDGTTIRIFKGGSQVASW